MFNGADVPELDSSHPLHKQQEVQECDADLLRGVMKVVLEEGEEVAQERMAQSILQHQTQTLVCVCGRGLVRGVTRTWYILAM